MARTTKQEFTNLFDLGVPIDPQHMNLGENDDVLILYGNSQATPNRFPYQMNHQSIPSFNVLEAVENCHTMNVILTQNIHRNQCLVIMPQYESYYIQKWMRIDARTTTTTTNPSRLLQPLNPQYPLQLVSTTHRPNGRMDFIPPDLQTDTNVFWSILYQYLSNVEIVLQELRPLLQSIASSSYPNTVIVMVCNMGQSELLLNFV
jgi:hypothetical protein